MSEPEASDGPNDDPQEQGDRPEVVIRGKRGAPLGLIASGLFCGLLAWEIIANEQRGIGLFLLLALAGFALWTGLASFLRRPQVSVAGGKFWLRGRGQEISCPAGDVANVVFAARRLMVVFRGLENLQPEHVRGLLRQSAEQTGAHFQQPPGIFTLEQVNEVRRALGMMDQPAELMGEEARPGGVQSPWTSVTAALVAVNLVVFILVLVAGGQQGLVPNLDAMLQWGANYGPKTLDGQWWRLLTSMFLHAGVPHLFFNMWALWYAGRLIESLTGRFGFLVIYLISGLAGSMVSVFWHPEILSIGASGAIFGLFGAMFGLLNRSRDVIPAAVLAGLRNSGIIFVVFNLFLGGAMQGVDNAAHVGGLFGGLALGLVVGVLSAGTGRKLWLRNLAVATGGAGVLVLAAQFLPPPPPDMLDPPPQVRDELSRFERTHAEVLTTFDALVHRKQVIPAEFERVMRQEVLAPWREERQRLTALETTAPQLKKVIEYMQVREEAWQDLMEGVRSHDKDHLQGFREKQERADELGHELFGGSRSK